MSENLHCKIDKEFLWYNDLSKIWGSNPSFSAKTSLSKLGADHASDLFNLTHPAGGSWDPPAGSSHAHPQLNGASRAGSSGWNFSGHDGYSLAPPEHKNYHDNEAPFNDGPLIDDMEDLYMNGIDEFDGDENMICLNSLPKSAKTHGKKQQLPLSPTVSPPQSVAAPSCTSIHVHNGHTSFKSYANNVIKHESTSSIIPSLRALDSVKKCLQTEVQEQVELLNNNLESMHSDKLMLYQLKNKCLMVKLNININCQDKEHGFLYKEYSYECGDAALIYQHLQENKVQDIYLWKVDTKALKLEREVMLLCIEYAKLNQK
ncbi:hypothetical protein BDR05DRAFT_1006752 [Suillus weaverae]|nr:hypothetical protein BDR05DRAFT_1006752 [Suillus weaverae]